MAQHVRAALTPEIHPVDLSKVDLHQSEGATLHQAPIDLHGLLITSPRSSFLLRVSGQSMRDAGILHGDLLIIDRAIEPRAGHVVVALLNGGFTVKYLRQHQGSWQLEAAHPDYPTLRLDHFDDVQIWGIATHSIHTADAIVRS